MNCPKCGTPGVIVEALDKGDKRIKCGKCGLNEVYDDKGRKLLMDAGSRGNVLLS